MWSAPNKVMQARDSACGRVSRARSPTHPLDCGSPSVSNAKESLTQGYFGMNCSSVAVNSLVAFVAVL